MTTWCYYWRNDLEREGVDGIDGAVVFEGLIG